MSIERPHSRLCVPAPILLRQCYETMTIRLFGDKTVLYNTVISQEIILRRLIIYNNSAP